MKRHHDTYEAAHAEAQRRANELGIEVAIRERDDHGIVLYTLQQRFEYMTEGRRIAVVHPEK